MENQNPDRELVEQVLAGNPEAFNLLVWRWQRPLYNFLLRLSGDRELARDLSQETFLRSYTRLKDLRDRDKFASWLFRISVNLFRSQQRSTLSQPQECCWEHPLLEEASVSEESARELQLAVRTLVSRLPAEQREVLLLKVYHGFQFNEIAEIVGCPVSTVKSRLYTAFAQIRTGLEQPKATLER